MLRISLHRNHAAARSYYTSAAEYYGAGQEDAGVWGGKAADRLGLAGAALEDQFSRVLGNRDPFTGEQLTARMRKDRRVAYDFNFHACKSLSLLHALSGDPAILDAVRQAVADTMSEIEQGVAVRVRKRGQTGERRAGNCAYALFLHRTARPAKGVIDPHLHVHCVIPNVCWDAAEGMWKAIDVASVHEDAPHWQAMFHRLLGRRIEQLGYPVAWKGDTFEIAGVGRELIERFSHRAALIDRTAADLGITDPSAKDRLGARTREGKRRDASWPYLRQEWRQRLTGEERAAVIDIALRRRHSSFRYRDGWERERLGFIRQEQRRQTAAPAAAPPGADLRAAYGR